MRPELPRLATAVAALAFLQVGPVTHQVLGRPEAPLTSGWRMYAGRGRHVCRVTWWEQRGVDRVPLDVTGLLHPGKRPWDLPRKDRLQNGPAEVRRTAADACRRARVDVRADAWCGFDASGRWAPVLGADEPLCPVKP